MHMPSHRIHITIFFFNAPTPTDIYTLSLHDALPISTSVHPIPGCSARSAPDIVRHAELLRTGSLRTCCRRWWLEVRSEEHTSELQSQSNLVCRLLLEKKKTKLESAV